MLPNALTSLAKVKAILGITDTSQDTFLTQMINQTTVFIEGYCGGRKFLSQTYTQEVYDTDHQRKLFLKQYPMTAFTLLEYRSGTVTNPNWTTYDANSYMVYLKEGYLHFFGYLPRLPQSMRCTYTSGYLIDFTNETDITKHTLPFDLTMVATNMVVKFYLFRKSKGISSESTEGQSVTFSISDMFLDKQDKAVLIGYQLHYMAY